MSLIVEDGTVVAGAESYCSVAAADTYFSNRNNTAWAALTTSAKEAALRKATDYMGQVYRSNWVGYRFVNTQALDWPRQFAPYPDSISVYRYYPAYFPSNQVPSVVVNACAELAYRASIADLSPDVEQRVLREKIGPIETEYSPYSPQYTTYRAIDNLVAPFLKNGGGASHGLVRT